MLVACVARGQSPSQRSRANIVITPLRNRRVVSLYHIFNTHSMGRYSASPRALVTNHRVTKNDRTIAYHRQRERGIYLDQRVFRPLKKPSHNFKVLLIARVDPYI